MIILGVDPGSTATGYGIISKNGVRSIHVASGVIRPSPQWAMPRRLWDIHEKLDAVIRMHSPTVMVVESLFHFKNAQSLMKLSQVRGVILLMGERHGMQIFEYAPMEIKKGLTGYGAADKNQVIFMVGKVLGLPDLKSPDRADALAMALYHSHLCVPEKPSS
jgi:crossover junction endodeoxyribonuclease RuvC